MNLESQEQPDDKEPGLHAKREQSHQMILAGGTKDSVSEKNLLKSIDWRRAWLKVERSGRRILQ